MSTAKTFIEQVQELPRATQHVQCGKCGRDLVVGHRTVMAFCRDCSASMGVKK